ncbi:100K [Titi monkey adenovirus ECC-2011]|uniref:Shutoff protein n=1 Tax=titi monkey adenovirus 1 TaxID=3123084 RepID=G0ZAI7_9ADEN|nr:100K [Titi monkey adenovirus ECC-2011]AEK98458.1 100K [Titi monkey adenovirus ECC-2011]
MSDSVISMEDFEPPQQDQSTAPPTDDDVPIESDVEFLTEEQHRLRLEQEADQQIMKKEQETQTEDEQANHDAVQEEDDSGEKQQQRHGDGYITDEILLTHIARQSLIVQDALADRSQIPLTARDLTEAYEQCLFSPRVPPKRQPNGTCEPNPRLNFYPPFVVPEVLATYHIFFQNCKIPLSCRANRTAADERLALGEGDSIPDIASLEEVPKIFEGLGRDEKRAANSLQGNGDGEESQSALVELEGDNARLAVLKRSIDVTHAAYPAINLPPKVMSALMDQLLIKRAAPIDAERETYNPDEDDSEDGKPVVSDQELARWLNVALDSPLLEERRKTLTAVLLVTLNLECLRRFFSHPDTLRKLEESLHYTFRHGYVRQACKISNVELSNLVSYMGILHENRLGQNVLHSTLKGEARRDYIRDCIYLYLVYTWQTAMGVWQQCLEERNVQELEKILQKQRRALYTGFDERTIAAELATLVFPEKLMQTLQNGLPDFVSQSMLHNFRSFILERSGILPAMSCALPSDFVPISFRECPPPLWAYTYLFQLANYLMYHSDVVEDATGEGLMECHCRCNLCTPHRSLICNPALLSESQVIGTFEIQGPDAKKQEAGEETAVGSTSGFKLTAGLWTSAYLRKFVPEDYHAHTIKFYEHQSPVKSRVEPSACVITQSSIVAQLQAIQKARESFLLKKGKGVYLDPQTGEELNPLPPAAQLSLRDGPAKAGSREEATSTTASPPHLGGRRGGVHGGRGGPADRRGGHGGSGRHRGGRRGGGSGRGSAGGAQGAGGCRQPAPSAQGPSGGSCPVSSSSSFQESQ